MVIGKPFRSVLVLPLLASCASLERQTAQAGFVPLKDLDFVSLAPAESFPAEIFHSNQILLGAILAPECLQLESGHKILKPVRNPLVPTFAFEIDLAAGPRTFTVADGAQISGNVHIGSWVDLGLKGGVSTSLQLGELRQATLRMTDEQMIPFLAASDPVRLTGQSGKCLWVTGILAADINNMDESGIDFTGTSLDSRFPVDVSLRAGGKTTVSGPSLVFGLRLLEVTAHVRGHVPEAKVPDVGTTVALPLPGTPLQVSIARPSRAEALFTIRGGDADTWVKGKDDHWRRDVVQPNQPLVLSAKIASDGREPAANLGDGFVRLILVSRGVFDTSVVSLLVEPYGDSGNFRVSGHAYALSVKPVYPIAD